METKNQENQKDDLSREEVAELIRRMNETTDRTPFAYLLGREFCGVLFYLFVGSVRSKVFRRLLETVLKYIDESDPKEGFPSFLTRCLNSSTSDIFTESELDNYFHARVSKDLDFEKMEE